MIAIDTNILVYAHRETTPQHQPAERCLERLVAGTDRWALPWPCAHEFFSIVTNPRIYASPTPPAVALDILASLQSSRRCEFIGEGVNHLGILSQLVEQSGYRGPRVHDARVAAVCLAHGVREIWTADRDFAAFAPLKAVNPLIAGFS